MSDMTPPSDRVTPEQLREHDKNNWENIPNGTRVILLNAASTIEALERENEELKRSWAQMANSLANLTAEHEECP